MLLSQGHGKPTHRLSDDAPPPSEPLLARIRPLASALSGSPVTTDTFAVEVVDPAPEAASPPRHRFAYLFAGAASFPDVQNPAAAIDAIATAMTQTGAAPEALVALPAILTYFGQFIDHDITASSDRDVGPSVIDTDTLVPGNRDAIAGAITNLRSGRLDLDSLYGDAPGQSALGNKLAAAMRDGARMRLGTAFRVDRRPTLPLDDGTDLPRFGALAASGGLTLTDAELDTLEGLTNPTAQERADARARRDRLALIGDERNDENLVVAQFHLALLRLHNATVDAIEATTNDPDAQFRDARRFVTWTYQWLVVNEYLARICDPSILDAVLTDEAKVYGTFRTANHDPAHPDLLPLPFEFSAAAFRFGHSMVRERYDYNLNFGDPDTNPATLDDLFTFTGRGFARVGNGPGIPTLPTNWIIDWDRFVRTLPAFPVRRARAIDTEIAPALRTLTNEPPGVFRNLAVRNLRRGYVMNLPSAQACIAGFAGAGIVIPALSRDDLLGGRTGPAVGSGGFVDHTPLWLYVLREAEVQAGGRHLGALGSRLVAETLVGLIVQDPTSYWNDPSRVGGRWTPTDGPPSGGLRIRSLETMLRAAGVLD